MDIVVGVSNCVARVVVILMVHDFIIVGNFGVFGNFGGPFNILTRVTFSSYNVPIVSTNRQKMVTQVPYLVLCIERRMWCKF